VGEALVCGLPVVAYDVETYRPIFGEFLRYVPCFDAGRFGLEAQEQVLKMRAGENYLNKMDLTQFIQECSWETAHKSFVQALDEVASSEIAKKDHR
jgi:hypothetical protein